MDLDDLSILGDNWNTPAGMEWGDGVFGGDGDADLDDLSCPGAYRGCGTSKAAACSEDLFVSVVDGADPSARLAAEPMNVTG